MMPYTYIFLSKIGVVASIIIVRVSYDAIWCLILTNICRRLGVVASSIIVWVSYDASMLPYTYIYL